jgi:phage repressor protein C with HTH and peptisase S24 domain
MDIQSIRRLRLAQLISENYGSQAKFIDSTGENQGEVSALLKSKSFGEKKARKIEMKAGLPAGWLDTLDSESATTKPSPIRAIHPDDAPSDDIVYVQESRISFSAGNGRTASYELIEDEEPASYRLSWFQKYGINPNRVKRFRVSGDSMEPMLFDRDTILVNMDETSVVDNKMYAIRYGDELRVKYLRKTLDGTLILRSINPLYKEEEVSPVLASEHISIIGRVRDASGTGGL